VPYLPGSSVKGVLRRAAEELALFEADSQGWTLAAVWWLFGFDANSAFYQQDKRHRKTGEYVDPNVIREERERWRNAYRTWSASLNVWPSGGSSRSADLSPHDPGGLLEAYRALVDPRGEHGTTPLAFLQTLQESASARNSIHTRGSLAFWDVIPVPGKGDAANLRVDIMNPHYTHYYQGNEPPHDAGSPNPIFYLTVPAGWRFPFTVDFLPVADLPAWFTEEDNGEQRWKALLRGAFEHAFDWIGFGAKTSLGYGGITTSTQWVPPPVEHVRLAAPVRTGGQPERHGQRRSSPSGDGATRRSAGRAVPDPLVSKIEVVRPNDRAAIAAVADEIAGIEDETKRRKLALLLRERVGHTPFGRVVLNNHPVLKKYR